MNTRKILICDDDELTFKALASLLKNDKVSWVPHADSALEYLKKNSADLLILDLSIRTEDEGLAYLPVFKKENPDLPIIILSGSTQYSAVRNALKTGATDYLHKEAPEADTLLAIERALRHFNAVKESDRFSKEIEKNQTLHPFIGDSDAVKNLRRQIEKLRAAKINVLILGEPGTGKEIVARQLRSLSASGHLEPFVSIDSSTIHASTAESILFGNEKGAFTGADKTKKGLFEEANGGTIYFDEIGNMPLEIQAKLLRVLQEKEVLRLGSSRPIPLEFRVLAATNRKLNELNNSKEFRSDLLERVAVVPLHVPPLRERGNDILLLADYFLKTHSHRPGLRLTEEARSALMAYPWPGNVRELKNVIAYVATMSDHEEIETADLPVKIWDRLETALPQAPNLAFYDQVKNFERQILEKEYKAAKGNVSQLAKNLKMDRSHLHQKLKSFGIPASE